MLLLIDNYDSFTFNLWQLLGELGVVAEVRRNDAITSQDALAMRPDAIVLSPGPGTPESAGICLPLVGAAASAGIPLLGICLGHQAIGQAFGGEVVRAPAPVHGKVWPMRHEGADLFAGLPDPLPATRYHSLVVRAETLPPALEAIAWTEDGLVMALRHRDLPIRGLQFHPESIASEGGPALVANFLALAGIPARVPPACVPA